MNLEDKIYQVIMSSAVGAFIGALIVISVTNCMLYNQQQKTNELLQEIIEGGQHVR